MPQETETVSIAEALKVFQKHWGHKRFRKAQEKVIETALRGEDVLAVLPTGYGKSATFQVPAICYAGTAIVVSPLISLMKDQVDDCISRGIEASYINSHVDEDEQQERLENLMCGAYKVFYVAPERMDNQMFRDAIVETDVNFFVVDEAHAHQPESEIWTPEGPVACHYMRPGTHVMALDKYGMVGVQSVREVKVRNATPGEYVSIFVDEDVLRVTTHHPVYLKGVGYVPAASIEEGDEILHVVWEDVHSRNYLAPPPTATKADDALLFVEVFYDLPQERNNVLTLWNSVAAAIHKSYMLPGVFACSKGRWFVAAHDRGESHALAEFARFNARHIEAHGASTPGTGREWEKTTRGAADGPYVVCEFEAGVFRVHRNEAGREEMVHQSGLCSPEEEKDHRGRWGKSRINLREEARPASGQAVRYARVGRVARVERGSASRSDADAQEDRRVFTLEVTGGNYIADGILNHNCASRWGHDFRPKYMLIHKMLRMVTLNGNRPPVIAVTATATSDIEDDIAKSIGMDKGYQRIVGDPIRPNLQYTTLYGNVWKNLDGVIRRFDVVNGRHIIYAGTRKATEFAAKAVGELLGDELVSFYHAGMPKIERERTQNNFKSGRTPVICATCAFGMGIDVPNIRTVVHFGISGSLEDYQQETGRAGRDGKKSDLVLIHDDYGPKLRQMFLNSSNPPYSTFEILWEYLHKELQPQEILRKTGSQISREFLLEYGEKIHEREISGALATMVSQGLVHRDHMPTGTTLNVRVKALYEALQNNEFVKLQKIVATHLWEEVLEPQCPDDVEQLPLIAAIEISTATVAASMSLPEMSFKRVIKKLSEKGLMDAEPVFRGKTTRILKYGEELNDILPREKIEEKRARAQARLNKMIEYAYVKNMTDRVRFIRDYFLKGL